MRPSRRVATFRGEKEAPHQDARGRGLLRCGDSLRGRDEVTGSSFSVMLTNVHPKC